MLFDYPIKAAFGRVLPKSKIYEHAGPSKGLKELFVRQVDQIVWKYKLAPETINLPSTKAVGEIQIFHLSLKTGELKDDVLRCIDKAVPFPIIFELNYEDKCKVMACYKRSNEADSTKWVTSDYFGTQWLPQNTPRSALPVVLNLTSLYESLLDPLLPHKSLPQEPLAARIARMESIRWKEHEIRQLELRLQREKQFNRKVEINAEIRAIKLEIEGLIEPSRVRN
ncbi:MAG: DUF4391 domain-containing protein [Pseudomonadaceae bacterium]|nr:DUF4391 domain-containing protein [Pseudomonadaceae bacterium]